MYVRSVKHAQSTRGIFPSPKIRSEWKAAREVHTLLSQRRPLPESKRFQRNSNESPSFSLFFYYVRGLYKCSHHKTEREREREEIFHTVRHNLNILFFRRGASSRSSMTHLEAFVIPFLGCCFVGVLSRLRHSNSCQDPRWSGAKTFRVQPDEKMYEKFHLGQYVLCFVHLLVSILFLLRFFRRRKVYGKITLLSNSDKKNRKMEESSMYVCIEVALCGDVHGIGCSNWAKGRDPSGSWVPSIPRHSRWVILAHWCACSGPTLI